jgi:DNA-binding transcriptional LysR family regulator
VPYASDELALVLPTKHALARLSELTKDDLYRLGFVCLDAQSTTRKMVDQLLARSGLDVGRLKIEMELNSFEAIKNAVQSGLGAAFLPVVSIERELAAGTLHRPQVADLLVRRQLKLITHPARYCSRASDAFRKEVLPVFASPDSPLRRPLQTPQGEP